VPAEAGQQSLWRSGGFRAPQSISKKGLKAMAVSSDAVGPLQAGLLASRWRVRQPYRRSDASLGSRQRRLSIEASRAVRPANRGSRRPPNPRLCSVRRSGYGVCPNPFDWAGVSCTDKDEAPGALLALLQRAWPLLRWRLPFDQHAMDRRAQLRVNKVA
jgi:hypothetical protein